MPSLTSMAEAILARAKKLDAYLESKDIPYPSFDEDTLDRLPDELQDDRWALANASNDLKKLACGAAMNIMDMSFSVGAHGICCFCWAGNCSQCQTLSKSPDRHTVLKLTSAFLCHCGYSGLML